MTTKGKRTRKSVADNPIIEPSLEEIRSRVPRTRRSELSDLDRMIAEDKGNKRKKTYSRSSSTSRSSIGSRTRGWRAAAPHRGAERKELEKKCPELFLGPNQSFPIGNLVNGKCAIDRRGVHAAYQRARQYGHTAIAAKAERLLVELGEKPNSRTTKKRTSQSKSSTAKKRSGSDRSTRDADAYFSSKSKRSSKSSSSRNRSQRQTRTLVADRWEA